MNRHEVSTWMKYHGSVLPDWDAWYMKPGKERRAIAFQSYAKALAKIDLEDATAATDAMVAGDLRKPFLAEDHLARIIEHAAKTAYAHAPRPRYSDGQRTFNCPHCEDRGLVLVATDRTYQFGGRAIPVRSEARACSCPRGDGHKRGGVLPVDPKAEST